MSSEEERDPSSSESEVTPSEASVPERRTWREEIRHWLRVIPGTKRDYFLISLALIDVVLIMVRNTFEGLFPLTVLTSFVIFDFVVLTVWGIEFLMRLRREKNNRWTFALNHWYEVVGLIPLTGLRFFLLLRAVKLLIAYYKLGRSSDRDVTELLTQEFTFRFRDVIVNSIADAVFHQSLDRVEEVMTRLDYSEISKKAMVVHEPHLRAAISNSLLEKSMVGELRKVPLMGSFVSRVGDDVGQLVVEVMQEEIIGDIMKEITGTILAEMRERLKRLDLERLAQREAQWTRPGGEGALPEGSEDVTPAADVTVPEEQKGSAKQ